MSLSGQLRIFAVALVAAFVLILPATAGAASIPSSVEVVPGNPYYLLVQAQSEAPTTYGQKIGTCVIEAETSCPAADLTGARLNSANLSYAKLSGASLRDGSLVLSLGSFLRAGGADFSNVNFIGSSLAYANLRNANLSGATTTFAGFTNADMRGAQLVGTDGYFGAIVGSDLRGANMRGMDFSNSDVNGTDMRGADMREMNLTNADFTGSRMGGVDLKGSHFCNTLMPSGKVIAPRKGLCPGQIRPGPPGSQPIAVPSSSPMFPAIYALQTGTQVQAGERVSGCEIEAFTKCPRTNFKDKSLQGAFLAYANLNGSDLRNVNFPLGSLAYASATKAKFDGANLGATSIVDADLRGASLRRTSLGLTVLSGVDLQGADLTGARTDSATDLRGANFEGCTGCPAAKP